jgi:hypothetical protein
MSWSYLKAIKSLNYFLNQTKIAKTLYFFSIIVTRTEIKIHKIISTDTIFSKAIFGRFRKLFSTFNSY